MNTLPAWFYNDLQQVGVDFEDTALAAFDRNQALFTIEASAIAKFFNPLA